MTTIRRRWLRLGFVPSVVLVSISCGSDVDPVAAPVTTGEPIGLEAVRESLACNEDPTANYNLTPTWTLLSEVSGWWIVESVGIDGSIDPATGYTVVEVVGRTSPEAAATQGRFLLYPGSVAVVERALKLSTATVYVGVGSTASPALRDVAMVTYAVDGPTFSFLGECAAMRANDEFVALFGDRASDVLRNAAGLTGEALLSAIAQPPVQTTPEVLQIVPGMTHSVDDLPKGAVYGALYVSVAESGWSTANTFCVRSPVAWGGCSLFTPTGDAMEPMTLGYAYDPTKGGEIEVWLFEETADPSQPLGRVATVSVADLGPIGRALVILEGSSVEDPSTFDSIRVVQCVTEPNPVAPESVEGACPAAS